MAIREERFSGPSHETLVKSAIRGSISYVSQTFRKNDRPNPTKDEDGELGRVLLRHYRAYKNSDPNQKQQKATPIFVVAEVFKNKSTETQRVTSQLAIGGYFLCMKIVRLFNGSSSREEKDQHSEATLSEILQIQERTTTQ